MLTDDFAEDLPGRLRAALDQVRLPDPDWQAARRDLTVRVRRRRVRTAAAASAAAVLMATTAVAVSANLARHGHGHGHAAQHVALLRFSQTASVVLGGNLPPSLAYGDGRLFAATDRGRLLQLDPASLRITGRLRVGRPLANARDGVVAMPIAYGGHAFWILDRADRQVWRVDPANMRVTMRLSVGRASELAYGSGSLWVTTCCVTDGANSALRLTRIDPATGRVTGSLGLPGDGKHGWGVGKPVEQFLPNGIGLTPLPSVVLAAGRVILIAGPNTPVFAVDPRRMLVLRTFHVGCDGCEQPLGVAIGPDGLYATSIDEVVRLDLATGRVVADGPPGGLGVDSLSPAPLVAGRGGVWLLTDGPAPCGPCLSAALLDPVTLTVTARLTIQADGSVLPVGTTLYVTSYGGALERFVPARRQLVVSASRGAG